MKILLPAILSTLFILLYSSCSKDSPAPGADGCSGVNIIVTASVSPAGTGLSNGAINASASGSTNFTYSLNGGTFQSSGSFSSLASGNYTITAKNSNGCTGSAQFTVGAAVACTGTPGPLFTAVKQLLSTSCALSGCHIGPTPQNGLDFTSNCMIVDNSARIKARAVDGAPSFMPPLPNPQLSAADKQKIVAWVNAGGQVGN